MAVFTPVLTIALIYVAFLAIGWVAGRRADKTAADFMIAGRGLPLWLATLTMTAKTIGRIRTRGLTEPALSDAVRTPSSPSHSSAQYALSRNGTLAYVAGDVLSNEIVWVDRKGKEAPVMRHTERRMYYQPRLSPDGRQLAITVAGGNDDIWIHHFETGVLSRFTTSGANYLFPCWTPDGSRLVFFRSDTRELLWQRADRTTSPEVLAAADQIVPHSWSPDGQQLVVTEPGEGGGADIRVLRVVDGQRRPLVATRFTEVAPGISPDGRWLAYTSDESGRFEVYVVPFPGGGARIQISRDGGTEPVWAKDGRELFFRQDQRLMAVATTPRFGTPIALFDAEWWMTRFSTRPNYDVASGGQQFVFLKSSQRADSARIHVIINWAAGLK